MTQTRARIAVAVAVPLLLAVCALAPLAAGAQQCPRGPYPTNHLASGMIAFVSSTGMGMTSPTMPAALWDFGQGSGCTTNGTMVGMAFGPYPPQQCQKATGMLTGPDAWLILFRAVWTNFAHNTSMNGCSFICGGVTCKVKGGTEQGLPVELLDFSVDDDEPAEPPPQR